MKLENKLEEVKKLLKDQKILIAFSGGADSTLVAKMAVEMAKTPLAVTIDNGVLPKDCISNAKKIADELGIEHQVIKEDFLEDPKFRENNPNRCFICKNKMYSKLEEIAEKEDFPIVVDGTNISDLLEDRPGIMVNYQKNIFSPLVEAGMTREDVLEALEKNKINYSKSTTCMATRIATGEELSPKKINRINYAESLIKTISKSSDVRVRDYGGIGQIQVPDISPLLNAQTLQHIDAELKAVGFKQVTLDIGGYGKTKKDLVVYKPCKDEAHKIMFETELPYEIDIQKTCAELEEIGSIKCSPSMGIAMMELNGRNVTVFKNGKIVARRVIDADDAQELLIKVLPKVRRLI
jgi:uncharacterized protein